MKLLVLALCVCAASAATFYKPYNTVQTPVREIVTFPVVAAKAVFEPAAQVATKPVYQPVAVPAVKNAYYSGKEAEAPVVHSDSTVTAEGFNYAYETGNGIAAQATGALKRVGDADVFTSQGSYRYYAPDGTPMELTYIADENGFQPQSNFLPVAPPTPEAILRSLAYIADQTARKVTKY